jgi:hypothetical protein
LCPLVLFGPMAQAPQGERANCLMVMCECVGGRVCWARTSPAIDPPEHADIAQARGKRFRTDAPTLQPGTTSTQRSGGMATAGGGGAGVPCLSRILLRVAHSENSGFPMLGTFISGGLRAGFPKQAQGKQQLSRKALLPTTQKLPLALILPCGQASGLRRGESLLAEGSGRPPIFADVARSEKPGLPIILAGRLGLAVVCIICKRAPTLTSNLPATCQRFAKPMWLSPSRALRANVCH